MRCFSTEASHNTKGTERKNSYDPTAQQMNRTALEKPNKKKKEIHEEKTSTSRMEKKGFSFNRTEDESCRGSEISFLDNEEDVAPPRVVIVICSLLWL